MKEQLQGNFELALRAVLEAAGDGGEMPEFALEPARQAEHGDFACNAAMVIAKRLRKPPREIANDLIAHLKNQDATIQRLEVAGPGFVNVWLGKESWHGILRQVIEQGVRYGCSESGQQRPIQVEFVSANPTGPLTLGHGRQCVLGDTISRLLGAVGYEVTREYYFNNGGRQMRVLGDSVKARYLEALGLAAPPSESALTDPDSPWPESIDGLPVVFPRDGYQGGYIEDLARGLLDEHGDGLVDGARDEIFKETAEREIFREIRATLNDLGVHFDVYSNETDLYENGKIEEALADLRKMDLVYEKDGAVWFRATRFQLDRDRVLVKSSGDPTYLLPDIAYHREKFRRGFESVVDIQGADHIEQFPFVKKAAEALGCPEGQIELVMHQFVTLTQGGDQVKQSTRRATYVTVDELLREVGVDVFRFFMVQRRAESQLDFDLDLAKETDWKKNPAYYVQYAHARTHGIERKAREQGVEMPDANTLDASQLTLPEEIEILKKISEFPEMVSQAAETREPHHLAYYARELAGLWNPYVQDGSRHRILGDDATLTNARLGLVLGVRIVLANTLSLLGITAPETM
ncbi:arginine--tRNA ligase [Myxococcota bacterium]|nr:arginine--tRNA ligase [Myxococcota bacterium]